MPRSAAQSSVSQVKMSSTFSADTPTGSTVPLERILFSEIVASNKNMNADVSPPPTPPTSIGCVSLSTAMSPAPSPPDISSPPHTDDLNNIFGTPITPITPVTPKSASLSTTPETLTTYTTTSMHEQIKDGSSSPPSPDSIPTTPVSGARYVLVGIGSRPMTEHGSSRTSDRRSLDNITYTAPANRHKPAIQSSGAVHPAHIQTPMSKPHKKDPERSSATTADVSASLALSASPGNGDTYQNHSNNRLASPTNAHTSNLISVQLPSPALGRLWTEPAPTSQALPHSIPKENTGDGNALRSNNTFEALISLLNDCLGRSDEEAKHLKDLVKQRSALLVAIEESKSTVRQLRQELEKYQAFVGADESVNWYFHGDALPQLQHWRERLMEAMKRSETLDLQSHMLSERLSERERGVKWMRAQVHENPDVHMEQLRGIPLKFSMQY